MNNRLRNLLLLLPLMSILSSPSVRAAALPGEGGSFAAFDRRARAGERLNVVFLGGSLTWGARSSDPQHTSYRALVGKKLEEHYPDARFTFWDAAVGGTGSQLGAFRLQRDVIARRPDLVFIDFTVNDGATEVIPGKLAAYESLTRRVLLETGAPVELVILPVKKDALGTGEPRPLDARHKEIAAAYGTALADAVALARSRVEAEGPALADAMWDQPPDITHPGDKGYACYADAAWDAYLRAVEAKTVCRVPDAMLQPATFMSWNRQRLSGLGPLPQGWTVGLPKAEGCAYDFYMSRWLDDIAVAKPGAAPLKVKFNGTFVLLFGERTLTSGKARIAIDGKPAIGPDSRDGVYDTFNKAGTMHYVPIVAEGLDPAVEHTLEIDPVLEPGQELRIESLCVAGGRATVARE